MLKHLIHQIFPAQQRDLLHIQIAKSPLRFLLSWYYRRQIHTAQQIDVPYRFPKDYQSPLTILYRLSPVSNNKSPVFKHNKFELVKLCLGSFVEAFKKIDYKIVFLLDSCPSKYEQLIRSYRLKADLIHFNKVGNHGTWFGQLALASQLKDDQYVYFAEDDYYYLPDSGPKIFKALQRFDVVGPCDYPGYYQTPFVDFKGKTKKIANQQWREVESQCLTFGTQARLIKQYLNLFKQYGTFDYALWLQIRNHRHQLFSPQPTLSTHLVENGLAPGVDWIKMWN